MTEAYSSPEHKSQSNNLESVIGNFADLLRSDEFELPNLAKKIDTVKELLAEKGIFNEEVSDDAVNYIRSTILDQGFEEESPEQLAESIEEYLKATN